MRKVKNFADFMNENMSDELEMDDFNGILPEEDVIIDNEIINNEIIPDTEFKSEIIGDNEDEEIDDLLELIYNQRSESWDNIGELELPSDFESFQEWFMEEISDDDTTTASMKEEGEEIVFHIPEDIYIKYLEESDGLKDELDDIVQRDNFDENEDWDD